MNDDIEVVETEWITLPDGTRLAARLWLPAGAREQPVPAVLEHLPYRRRDNTAARDESTYPVFAANGIAGVRVDLRGSGDSDGRYDDEYSETELRDACDVIAWIAEQPWCTGAVGMMGISWGGFNALQVAAKRPPALKAVISLASSVDRYNDDIHYRNGCHLGAHLNWAVTVVGYLSRPPDSAVVGERWRSMWLDRLDALEPAALTWMRHQRRDAFWQRGSIGDDFAAVQVPALVIAGWADGYRNTPGKAVDGLGGASRALVGPWIHRYPHFGLPRPRVDFHAEAIAWWHRWLGGEDTGVEQLPQERAFLSEAVRAGERIEREAGRWVARQRDGDTTALVLHLAGDGRLRAGGPVEPAEVVVDTPATCGEASGVFFVSDPAVELPGEQSVDDAVSVVWETAPLDAPVDVLGRSVLRARVTTDRPQANLIARLVDVHPDGHAHLVALGLWNLSHRRSDESPEPMVPGVPADVVLALDAAGYRFRAGHRIRLALSTHYFPMVLPPPEPVVVRLALGDATLALPAPRDLVDIELPEPREGLLPTFPVRVPGGSTRTVERDGDRVTHHRTGDTGELEHPGNGMVWRERYESTATIADGDAGSFDTTESLTVMRRRDGVESVAVAHGRLRATPTVWRVETSLVAHEDGVEVFRRDWADDIPRDHM